MNKVCEPNNAVRVKPKLISVTKAIAGLQIRALLQLLGCLLMIDLTVCISKLLGGQLPVLGFETIAIEIAMKFYTKMAV